jgi:uncharacterized protein (TIGR01777 family)
MRMIGITGGTGFVGRHVAQLIKSSGDQLVIFTRDPEHHKPEEGITYAYWCPEENKCDLTALTQLDAVIHLAGAGIADKRWTAKRKKEIVDSRTLGTNFLVNKLKEYAPGCHTLIAASAIGNYGPDRGNKPFTEDDEAYDDFLAQTCVKWETATHNADMLLRTVILRFGIVLGEDGGAYPEFAKPMSFGVVPILGSGEQVMSWIHVHDLARLILLSIDSQKMAGTYNAVSPNPVKHKDLMKTIAAKKGGIKIPAPVPAFALKLALGEMSTEVLKSCTVSNQKLQNSGFSYMYSDIDKAISAIVDGKHSH